MSGESVTSVTVYGDAGDDIISTVVSGRTGNGQLIDGGVGDGRLLGGDGTGGAGADLFGLGVNFAPFGGDLPALVSRVRDFDRGADHVAFFRDGSDGTLVWIGATDFDTNDDGRVDDADDQSAVESVEFDGVERESLIRKAPLFSPETGDLADSFAITRFGITRLTAADVITSGELAWA